MESGKTFVTASAEELRAFIDGCHKARVYDSYFESACLELNSRTGNITPSDDTRDISGAYCCKHEWAAQIWAAMYARADSEVKFIQYERNRMLSALQQIERDDPFNRTSAGTIASDTLQGIKLTT